MSAFCNANCMKQSPCHCQIKNYFDLRPLEVPSQPSNTLPMTHFRIEDRRRAFWKFCSGLSAKVFPITDQESWKALIDSNRWQWTYLLGNLVLEIPHSILDILNLVPESLEFLLHLGHPGREVGIAFLGETLSSIWWNLRLDELFYTRPHGIFCFQSEKVICIRCTEKCTAVKLNYIWDDLARVSERSF